MRLLRIHEHLRQRDWLAVCLDFLIVVLGIFIGFQITNWNEGRYRDQRAAELRERLADDFIELDAQLATAYRVVSEAAEAATELRLQLEAGRLPEDAAAFGALYRTATSTHTPVSASPTYREMLTTGDLGLLKNAELRGVLALYDAEADRSELVFSGFLPRFLIAQEAMDPHVQRGRRDPETGMSDVISVDFDILRGQSALFYPLERTNINLRRQYADQLLQSRAVLSALGVATPHPATRVAAE